VSNNLRVRDLMTTGIYAVGPEAPVTMLQGLMIDKRIRHLPVVDSDGTLVGLVSERDVLRCAIPLEEGVPLSAHVDLLTGMRAADVMTRDVETVEADDDLAVAARIMLDNKYGCVPVFEEGVLTGILTEADFVRLLADEEASARFLDEDDEDDEDEDDAEGDLEDEDETVGQDENDR
jgi:CBS domain-containing protein